MRTPLAPLFSHLTLAYSHLFFFSSSPPTQHPKGFQEPFPEYADVVGANRFYFLDPSHVTTGFGPASWFLSGPAAKAVLEIEDFSLPHFSINSFGGIFLCYNQNVCLIVCWSSFCSCQEYLRFFGAIVNELLTRFQSVQLFIFCIGFVGNCEQTEECVLRSASCMLVLASKTAERIPRLA